jgi:WD40 repeat protein
VLTLRLLTAGTGPAEKAGEVLACAYSPDGAFVLSGSWDGYLRLWETVNGSYVSSLQASEKPVSTCRFSPDGKYWLSGSLEGLLAHWDALTHRQESMFLAHPRPVSAIVFSQDTKLVATASWDGNVSLWTFHRGREREGRHLSGHQDIVSGCGFTPDGQSLVSWSYDATVRLWDVIRCRQLQQWTRHTDRITAGSVSPDGRWVATGARNGVLSVLDLRTGEEVASVTLGAELRACLFLLDGETLATVDSNGRIMLHSAPELDQRGDLVTRLPVQCADLAPSGNQIALGCGDGLMRLVAIEGNEDTPLIVTARQDSRRTATMLQRLFGKSQVQQFYSCVCPACRSKFDLPNGKSGQSTPCPKCRRKLRVNTIARSAPER